MARRERFGRRLPGTHAVPDGHGFYLGHTATLPVCDASRRGELREQRGGAGVADVIVRCQKDDAEAYAWETIATGAGVAYLPLTGGTLTGDLNVPDEAYGAGWNASTEVPTKNAIYDKIESVVSAGFALTVAEEGVTVDATVNTLNFDGTDFNLTESPEDQINISLAYGTVAGTPAEGNHTHTHDHDGDYQPLDADLTTLAANITAAGHALVDDASAADQRTTLGLVAGGAGDIWAEKAGDTFTGNVTIAKAAATLTLDSTSGAGIVIDAGDAASVPGFTLATAGVEDWFVGRNASRQFYVYNAGSTADALMIDDATNATTFYGDVVVPDEAYGAGWDGSTEVPTKNALYDKIETLVGGGATIVVKEGGANVDAAAAAIDFDASDFNVTSSPAGEANIALAYGTGAGQPAEGNHTHTHDHDADYVNVAGDTMTGDLTIDKASGPAKIILDAASGQGALIQTKVNGGPNLWSVGMTSGTDFYIQNEALATTPFLIDDATDEPRLRFLAGTGNRLVQADADGDLSATLRILHASTTHNPANTANGARVVTTVTVTGAAVGDRALCSHTTIDALSWLPYAGKVSSTDTCVCSWINVSGANSDPGSGTVTCTVFKT